jgi:hypothetical protein
MSESIEELKAALLAEKEKNLNLSNRIVELEKANEALVCF